jgi:nicotinate-nucleotide pyrophosphorylase (carboxylating)
LQYFCVMNEFDMKLAALLDSAIEEDVGDGDHSTLSCIPADARGKAILNIKEEGILAGMDVAKKIFQRYEPSSILHERMHDGDRMKKGDIAFTVEANIHAILKLERLVLNIMQRMSGIATLTRKYVDLLQDFRTQVLDTRKTTPNFRLLEKEAVRIGGGHNHRMGLYDMIMLKDNHIDYAGGLENAIAKAREYTQRVRPDLKIEVETRNMEEVERVLKVGKVDRIMLDNFTPATLRKAVDLIAGRFETEASGGINLDTALEFAATGVDFISVGALIHQSRSLDLSLKAGGER